MIEVFLTQIGTFRGEQRIQVPSVARTPDFLFIDDNNLTDGIAR